MNPSDPRSIEYRFERGYYALEMARPMSGNQTDSDNGPVRGGSVLVSTIHERVQQGLWRLGLVIHCHQRPDRSFFWRGRQIPICARCFGLTIGAVSVPLYLHNQYLALAMIIVMLLDGGSQALRLRESNNLLRVATGFGCAIGLGGLLTSALSKLWNT